MFKIIILNKQTRKSPAKPPRFDHGSISPDINTDECF